LYTKYGIFIVTLMTNVTHTKAGGIPRKLATATQLKFPRNVADFKQATGFQRSRNTLSKLTFD
jgi:hypothetical protein